jgi:hypothetical protein
MRLFEFKSSVSPGWRRSGKSEVSCAEIRRCGLAPCLGGEGSEPAATGARCFLCCATVADDARYFHWSVARGLRSTRDRQWARETGPVVYGAGAPDFPFLPLKQMRGAERRAAHRYSCVPNIRAANANVQNARRAHHTPRLPALRWRLFFSSGRASHGPRHRDRSQPAPGKAFYAWAEPRTAGVWACEAHLPEPHPVPLTDAS